MGPRRLPFSGRILTLLAGVLVLRVTIRIVSNYAGYFPPDFASSDFLRDRESQFLGIYPWAFYTHVVTGPIALVLGLILVSDRFRIRFPGWHRSLGRLQVGGVLLLVTPSGLWMAGFAAAGPVAGVGLAALAIATASCAAIGVRAAAARRFADHRRWMWRCYLLLCSAVVLRLIGGLATVGGAAPTWVDPLATWMSWLGPLAVFELRERVRVRARRRRRPSDPDRARSRAARDRRELPAG